MPHSVASVATENASRYLQQLSKHWGHRFAVTFDPLNSTIDFGDGNVATLKASAALLDIDISSLQSDQLPRREEVVESHIKRFAFREELSFSWSRSE